MLLNKLESGFLLFQTPQGSVAVELTFWQRAYLLWTFRNFRQLSLPLLNPRQTALINRLFSQNAAAVSDEFEPLLRIGVVENFVPAAMAARVAPITIDAAVIAIDAAPIAVAERAEKEGAAIGGVEAAPKNIPAPSFRPTASWLRRTSRNLAAYKLVVRVPVVSKPVVFRFAGAIGALALCLYFMVAWHRIGAVSSSQAHNSPPQAEPSNSSPAPTPTPVAVNPGTAPEEPAAAPDDPTAAPEEPTATPEDPTAAPEVSAGATADPEKKVKPSPAKVASPEAPAEAFADQDDAVEPLPAKAASPAPATRWTMTPGVGSRRAAARVARSSGGSHTAAFSRVPTSARRMTLPPGSHGMTAHTAQSYFDLAKRQMAKGNYPAAATNYKRAWRMEENIAAVKTRPVRVRRAMQAQNDGPISSFPSR